MKQNKCIVKVRWILQLTNGIVVIKLYAGYIIAIEILGSVK